MHTRPSPARRASLTLATSLMTLAAPLPPALATLPTFSKVTLSAPPGASFPSTFGTNSLAANGTVAGYVPDPDVGYIALRFDPAGSPTTLGTPNNAPAWMGRGRSISPSGAWVAGTIETSLGFHGGPGSDLPVRWTADGTAQLLPATNGFDAATGYTTDINDSGQTIGRAIGGPNPASLIRWEPDGTPSPVALPSGDINANDRLNAINNAGTIVGEAAYDHRAVRWDSPSSYTLLPSPASLPAAWTRAMDINNAGLIVGSASDLSANRGYPVLWDAAGNPTLLPPVPGYENLSSGATSIDDFGRVLGTVTVPSPGPFDTTIYDILPVLWDTDHTPYLLSSLLADPTLSLPTSLNIGSFPTIASDANAIHIYDGILLTAPLPEPTLLSLLLPTLLLSRRTKS